MSNIDTGAGTAGKADVNSDFQLEVNLPRSPLQAGYSQHAFRLGTTNVVNRFRATKDGETPVAAYEKFYELNFNSAAATWRGRFGTNATTMTRTQVAGFARLNGGAITTTTTGISLYGEALFPIDDGGGVTRISFALRHANAATPNKLCDIGLGWYVFAAGQANPMIEFIGFRWDAAGALIAVVDTSNGVGITSQIVSVNGGVPYSDNVTRNYTLLVSKGRCEFLVDETTVAVIENTSDSLSLVKSAALPWIARLANIGVPTLVPIFDLGGVHASRAGSTMQYTDRAAFMGRHSLQQQPDVQALNGSAHVFPASGTIPTAATPSLTVAAIAATQLGGLFRANAAAFLVGAEANYPMTGWTNPVLPNINGATVSARTFLVRQISISPMIVTTVLVGGGASVQWYIAVGGTALTTATVDADGTTAVSTKAHRYYPLPRMSTFGAAAALGTIETIVGEHVFKFPTPIPVHPGEILSIGFRTKFVTAAFTSGTIDGAISVNGDWV